jgi:hypothetical protein
MRIMKKIALFGVTVLLLILGGAWGTHGVWWGIQGPVNTGPRVDAEGTITLGVGEEKRLSDAVITLRGVDNDSRCAVDVQCVSAGNVAIRMTLRVGTEAEELTYSSDAEPHWFEGYFIDVVEVFPEARSNGVIDPLSYRVTFSLTTGRKPGDYAPLFSEYPAAEIWSGESSVLQFEGLTLTDDEKKELESAAKKEVNFGGEYVVVSTPCAATCTLHTIVRPKTGHVVAYGIPASYGLLYVATSSLLIVNPIETIGAEGIASLGEAYEPNSRIGVVPFVSDYYSVKDDSLTFVGKYDVRTGEKRVCEPQPVSARNPMTLQEKNFPSLCDIPYGYEVFVAAPPEEFERNGQAWRRYRNEEDGIGFEYRKDPDGYTLTLPDVPKDNPTLMRGRYVLTNTKAHEEFLASTDAREGPPTLSVTVFDNPDGLPVDVWVKEHEAVSNFNPATSKPFATTLGGQKGILYNADGLYASSNVVVSYNGKIYLLTGTYGERTDPIYRDFDSLTAFFSFF